MMKEKCLCGNQIQMQFKDELGRVIDRLVTIKNVPIYYCTDCEEGYMTGPDCLQFADRVREAVELGVEELEFEREKGMEFDQVALNNFTHCKK